MKRLLLQTTFTILAVLAFTNLASAQADPRVGTWTLNVAKSKYTPGPPPASETRTYTAQGKALQVSIESVDPKGNRSSLRYTATDDGKDCPMTGLTFANAVSIKRIDARNFEVATKKDGKIIGTTRGEISKDGKTLTLTSQTLNPAGGAIVNIATFDKR
jgi:hypothetical protein